MLFHVLLKIQTLIPHIGIALGHRNSMTSVRFESQYLHAHIPLCHAYVPLCHAPGACVPPVCHACAAGRTQYGGTAALKARTIDQGVVKSMRHASMDIKGEPTGRPAAAGPMAVL